MRPVGFMGRFLEPILKPLQSAFSMELTLERFVVYPSLVREVTDLLNSPFQFTSTITARSSLVFLTGNIFAQTLLSESFETAPLLSGWTASEAASGAHAPSAETDGWSSPRLDTEPLRWFRFSFQSKAPGALPTQLAYIPKPNRRQHIPRIIEKLRGGQTLRNVAAPAGGAGLGDGRAFYRKTFTPPELGPVVMDLSIATHLLGHTTFKSLYFQAYDTYPELDSVLVAVRPMPATLAPSSAKRSTQ